MTARQIVISMCATWIAVFAISVVLSWPASADEEDDIWDCAATGPVIDATDGRPVFSSPPYAGRWRDAAGRITCDLTIGDDPAIQFPELNPGQCVFPPAMPDKHGMLPCLLHCWIPETGDEELWVGECQFPAADETPEPIPLPIPPLVIYEIDHGNPIETCKERGFPNHKLVFWKDGRLKSRCLKGE